MLSGSKRPTSEEIEALHHRAHDFCFIANSVLSEIVIEPPPPVFV
jgi:organic hydroperoxide reductase OsmC/OhrA